MGFTRGTRVLTHPQPRSRAAPGSETERGRKAGLRLFFGGLWGLEDFTMIYPSVGLSPALKTPTRWCPQTIAKLVNITPITIVYGRYNELVNGVYKPTYNWGAPSCMLFHWRDELFEPWALVKLHRVGCISSGPLLAVNFLTCPGTGGHRLWARAQLQRQRTWVCLKMGSPQNWILFQFINICVLFCHPHFHLGLRGSDAKRCSPSIRRSWRLKPQVLNLGVILHHKIGVPKIPSANFT